MWNFFTSSKEQENLKKKGQSQTMSSEGQKNVEPPHQQIVILPSVNYYTFAYEYQQSLRNDQYRSHLAYQDGGMTCPDQTQVDKLRSVGKQMLKIIGRKILSGSFNLTKLSFPIRACVPKTALTNSVISAATFPYFMNRAATIKDPMERFKLVMVALVSAPYYVNMFLKPLNPILGQTLQAQLIDGTKIYAQQISHHPPISYFLIIGPNNSYRFFGYYNFEISPSFNSLKLQNLGKRTIQFNDGGQIQASYPTSLFSGTFFGTSRCQEVGSCVIIDKKNNIECTIEFDKVKKKPTDYFSTVITVQKKSACKVYGTYCGFIQIDGTRYWDGRDIQAFPLEFKSNQLLMSDWSFRPDLIELAKENMDKGQLLKQQLQQIQRTDAKLRLKAHKKNH